MLHLSSIKVKYMKMKKIFARVFFGFILISAVFAQKNSEDDGTIESAYVSQEISAILKLEKDEKPNLIAKYEPEKGSKYYIYFLVTDRLTRTVFFKVEDGRAFELGRDETEYPFSRYVKEPQVVDALWEDFLARWIKRDGRDNLQERLDLRAHEPITEEEIIHYEKAGFKVPDTAQRVKDYN